MSIASLSKIFKITEKIDKALLCAKLFKIESKDVTLKANEGILEYSVVVLPKATSKAKKNVSFEDFDLRRIKIISSPGFREDIDSISTIDKNLTKSFVLNTKNLREDADQFNFKFDIECKTESVVKDLIRRDHQIEAVGEESNTYWLHAQIKKLQDLKDVLRKVNLLDIPFAVNVAVHQDIKTKFPSRRRRELDVIARWAHELDRNRKKVLSGEHLRLKRSRPKEKDITKLLNDLQDLFLPYKFKSYINVFRDFNFSDCYRGADFYDQIPFRTFPKWMAVISRTDLSVEKPAAMGELIYNKAKFQEDVEKAIEKK